MNSTAVLVTPNEQLGKLWAAALSPRLAVREVTSAVDAAPLVGTNTVIVADLPGLGVAECERLLASLVPGAIAVVCAGEALEDETLAALLGAGALDVVRGPVSGAALAARVNALLRTRLPQEIRARFVESATFALFGQLSRGILHDLSNPLAFVLANLRTLREYRDEIIEAIGPSAAGTPIASVLEDLGPVLDETLDGAGRLESMLQNVRSFVRPDSGQVASVELREAVDAALAFLHHELRSVSVDQQVARGLRVPGSELQVRQLLAHLLYAAVHALAPGAPQRLALKSAIEGTTVVLRMDAGPMDPELVEGTWRAYFDQGSMSGGKTSMSLAAARIVLREHSGSLRCEVAGDCLQVTIELPMERAG